MKAVVLLSILFLAVGCATEHRDAPVEEITQEELNSEEYDLSIFHLPSKWTTQHNAVIELKELQGYTLAVVMIYTSCQAACPRLVADMHSIDSKIPADVKDKVKLVLVSIDPETDTPERLNDFAKENKMTEDHWLLLRGTEETVREFANVLSMKYKQITPVDFSHSNIISVFDQTGTLIHQQEGLGVDNEETIESIIRLASSER